jgi:hypothetical protein
MSLLDLCASGWSLVACSCERVIELCVSIKDGKCPD